MTAYRASGRAESGPAKWFRAAAAAAAFVCCGSVFAAETAPATAPATEAGELVLDEAKMLAKLQRISADPTRLEARIYGYGYYGWGGYPYAAYYGYRSYYPRAYAYPGFYPPAYGSYYATPYYSAAYYAPAVYAAPAVYVAPVAVRSYYGGYGVGYGGYGYGCAYGGCYHW